MCLQDGWREVHAGAMGWEKLDVDVSREGREHEWWEEGRRAKVAASQSSFNGRLCSGVQGNAKDTPPLALPHGHSRKLRKLY